MPQQDSEEKDTNNKVIEEALAELEKSFGSGVTKKSKIVSRGFSLNELVKEDD